MKDQELRVLLDILLGVQLEIERARAIPTHGSLRRLGASMEAAAQVIKDTVL